MDNDQSNNLQTPGLRIMGGAPGGDDEDEPGNVGASAEYGFVAQGCEEIEKNLDEPSVVLDHENQAFQARMWGCFQNCARAVAQVYMTSRMLQSTPVSGRTPSPQPKPPVVEESFKSAAQHATSLYKDSIETSRRLIDLGIKTGSNRRTKEVLSFIKSKKKRFIKREELISFLVGVERKNLPSSSSRKSHSAQTLGNCGGGGGATGPFEFYSVHSGGNAIPGSACGSQQPSGVPPHFRLHECFTFPVRKHSSDTPSRGAPPSDDDPSSMLHLAVQQLFVAGSSSPDHHVSLKRPAPSDQDEESHNSKPDEDCSMQEDDAPDSFKRMRFY